MKSDIEFYTQDVDFPELDFSCISNWLSFIIGAKNMSCGHLSIIFCSDEYLLKVNREYLNHDYYTDIISFDYCTPKSVSGDLFISVDTVKLNSNIFDVDFTHELTRVIFHGVLHLLGWDDHSEGDKLQMRSLENFWLHYFSV